MTEDLTHWLAELESHGAHNPLGAAMGHGRDGVSRHRSHLCADLIHDKVAFQFSVI